MIEFYYNRIKHLRIAQPIIKDIDKLKNLMNNLNYNLAINVISSLTTKYEDDLQKIGIYLSGRPIIKGEKHILYSDYTSDDIIDDIEYLIMCLTIIGAVRYGVEKTIENAINKVIN